MARTEFGAALAGLGLGQQRVARLFSVGARAIRRWETGERSTPTGVNLVVRLLATGTVTIAEVEAAVAIPARTNGSAPAPPVAPAPEPTLVADAEAAAPADPGLTTVQEVVALTATCCRWPFGDPGAPGFHFCGAPAVKQPYCLFHRRMAHWTPPAWRRAGRPAPAPRPPF